MITLRNSSAHETIFIISPSDNSCWLMFFNIKVRCRQRSPSHHLCLVWMIIRSLVCIPHSSLWALNRTVFFTSCLHEFNDLCSLLTSEMPHRHLSLFILWSDYSTDQFLLLFWTVHNRHVGAQFSIRWSQGTISVWQFVFSHRNDRFRLRSHLKGYFEHECCPFRRDDITGLHDLYLHIMVY